MFAPFVERSPEWAQPIVISYDRNKAQSYEQLARHVLASINLQRAFLLVGESFSGPVALMVAARAPNNLVGVVLCASFAVNPRPLFSKLFFPALCRTLFHLGIPVWAIKHYLTGWAGSDDLVRAAASAVKSVSSRVLAARVGMVTRIDVTQELAECGAPLLYVAAKRDRLVSRRSVRIITDIKPDISVVEIDAPHFIAQSRPVEVWRAIDRLVEKHRLYGGG